MISEMARQAREAGRVLGTLSGGVRNAAIAAMAEALLAEKAAIFAANAADVAEAEAAGLAGPLLQRYMDNIATKSFLNIC